MSLSTGIRRYLRHLLALSGMALIALATAAYITTQQRLRFPWQQEMQLYAEFENAQAVTPGQGQTVDVAGVKVGEIGEVKLENGRALVRLDITEEDELGPVYANVKLTLRPKTGLNDMAVQMDPGRPDRSLPDDGRLSDGDRIPIENTSPNVNPDAVLAALDSDTRAYLQVLLNAAGHGMRGRGPDLRAILRASQPTLAHASRVSKALADRRAKVRRLVSNLRQLTGAAATKDDDLRSLVDAASTVLGTLGRRDADIQASLERLPGALRATRGALVDSRGLADDARPALRALRPVARELLPALVQARPLLRDATPVVRDDLRPLVRRVTPLLAKLRPSVDLIDRATAPNLVDSARVLNRTVNLLGYNPPGDEEGFLFHALWYVHNAQSILTTEDAHGVAWRGLVMGSCSTFPDLINANPALAPLGQLPLCTVKEGGDPALPLPKAGTPEELVNQARVPSAEGIRAAPEGGGR